MLDNLSSTCLFLLFSYYQFNMLDILSIVKYLANKTTQVRIDNNVFRLHYKATTILLATCSVIVTSKQYIGDPIDCIMESGLDKSAINTYCWIFSTFSVVGDKDGSGPYPGIRALYEDSETIHHKYYQWICFVLALQAGLFFLPHYIWTVWEGGRIRMLTTDLCSPLLDCLDEKDMRKILRYLSNKKLHNHTLYALQFLFCELLNVANVIFAVFLWNKVLAGRFLTYGLDVMKKSEFLDMDAVDHLFPKITKCEFKYFGPTGSVQYIDSICLLPLNIVNEKMFFFLWFWFFGLASITLLALLYDLLLFVEPLFRVYLLQAQARFVPRSQISLIVRDGRIGDWFLLHLLGRNLNPIIFGELLIELAEIFNKRKNGLKIPM